MRRTRRPPVKRIKKIEINNFKGLYGEYEINLTNSGKNLMLYGENGSGKSSVAKAIKLFFQSASEDVNIADYENVFIPAGERNSGYIRITIGDVGNSRSNQPYVLDNTNNRQTDALIAKANKIKGYLDYKSLLKTHYLDTDKVNVFELLVENLLTDFVNSRTTNTIETDWNKLKRDIRDKRTTDYRNLSAQGGLLDQFNDGVRELLTNVETKANELIEYFNYCHPTKFKIVRKGLFLFNLRRFFFFLKNTPLTGIKQIELYYFNIALFAHGVLVFNQ